MYYSEYRSRGHRVLPSPFDSDKLSWLSKILMNIWRALNNFSNGLPMHESDLQFGRTIRLLSKTDLEATGRYRPHLALVNFLALVKAWIFEGLWIPFPTVHTMRESTLRFGWTIRFTPKIDLEAAERSWASIDLDKLFSLNKSEWIFERLWIPFPKVHPVCESALWYGRTTHFTPKGHQALSGPIWLKSTLRTKWSWMKS